MINTTTKLDFGEQLSITQLESWYLLCLKALLAGESVFIDVSRLQKIDTAALQLLYQFHHQAQHDDIQVIWSDLSESFQQAINLSGLPFTMEKQQTSVTSNTMEEN